MKGQVLTMKTIGTKIAELRKQKGMTQEELGALIGISAQSVSKWENEISMPDITLLPILADLFDITIDALFDKSSALPTTKSEDIPDIAFDRILKTIHTTFKHDNFDAEFEEYRNEILADNNTATAFYTTDAALFGNQNIGFIYRKSSLDSVPLLENEEIRALLTVLSDPNNCKMLRYLTETRHAFVSASAAKKCGISKEEAEAALTAIKAYDLVQDRTVELENETVTFWERNCFHRMLHLYAILTLADFVTKRNDDYYCYKGNSKW